MPSTQIARRRRANSGLSAAVTALAQGARTAYNNRQMIQGATRAVKRKYDEYKKKSRSTRSSRQPLEVLGGGNDWTVSRKQVGYKKRPTLSRLARMMEVGMHKQIFRYQAITNFDTNVGYHKIANYGYTTTPAGGVSLPVHVYDLASFNNVGDHSPAIRFDWNGTSAAADLIRTALPGQSAVGAAVTSGAWQLENGEGTLTNSRIMRHDWSDIRINFYGPRKRTTKYEVLFVRVKDEFANPMVSAVTNTALKELLIYLERPCIYSNLQVAQGNIAKKMKIVKKYTYWVSAGQTTDVDTTVGKIKEARIFMRHDRVYNLDWRHEGAGTIGHTQVDGIDYETDQVHHNHPWHGSRLLMIIRAFAPERRTIASYADAADANVDPTYDILIRNSISTPA